MQLNATVALSSGTELLLQPFGSFLVNPNLKSYDVLNETSTGIALQFVESVKLNSAKQWALDNGVSLSAFEEFVNFLSISGYLVASKKSLATVSYLDDIPTLKATRAEIEITNRCNLSCSYCYAEANSSSFELSAQQWCNILEKMIEKGLRVILISGGEPFIYPGLFEVLEWASNRLIIEINTNGSLITPEIADRISKINPKLVQVSLDSPTAEYHDTMRGKGSHALALNAISSLVGAGIPTQVSMVLTLANENMLDEMRKLTSKLKVNLSAIPITRSGFATKISCENWSNKYIIDKGKQVFPRELVSKSFGFEPMCQAEIGYIAISHQGHLMPCNMGEKFFTSGDSRLIERRQTNWWEISLGDTGMSSTVSIAKAVPAEYHNISATANKRPCTLINALSATIDQIVSNVSK